MGVLHDYYKNDSFPTDDEIVVLQNMIFKWLGVKPFKKVLRPRQIQGLISFIYKNRNILCVLPTGYGKTIIALLCAIYLWNVYGERTIFVGVLKALTREQYEEFNELIPTAIMDGDHRAEYDIADDNWVILCITPETLDSILSNENNRDMLMEKVGLVITDETHNLGDCARGHRIENYKIIIRACKPEMRCIDLSATIGNPQEYADWLNADLIYAGPKERPVELTVELIDYKEHRFSNDFPDRKKNHETRMRIVRSLLYRFKTDCFMIFVTARKRTWEIAYELAGLQFNAMLSNYELIPKYKIAFHHAGLHKDERKYIENEFRNGNIRICVATTTLAMGVNVPADRVIVFDVEQWSFAFGTQIIDHNRTQQTMGRAGRPNLSEHGYAYILTPRRIINEMKDRIYNPLIVESTIKPRLHEKILRWIGSGLIMDDDDIIEMTNESFAHINPYETEHAIHWLKTFKFVNENDEDENYVYSKYTVNHIGLATVRYYITPETVVLWMHQLESLQDENDVYEVYTRFGAVPEYFNCVSVTEDDNKILNYAQTELGKDFPPMKHKCEHICIGCKRNNKCTMMKHDLKECKAYKKNILYSIPPALLKTFFLSFFDDLSIKYYPKKKYWDKQKRKYVKTNTLQGPNMSSGDRAVVKNAGRMFYAASYVFQQRKNLSNTLSTIAGMIDAGTLKKELIELCKLQGVAIKRAQRLYDLGITTIGKFLDKRNERKVMKGLKLTPVKARELIQKNKVIWQNE